MNNSLIIGLYTMPNAGLRLTWQPMDTQVQGMPWMKLFVPDTDIRR